MGREQPTAKSFCDLIVWRKSHDFVLGVYRLTSAFPKQENYGLALQFRRAAVSIPANIAEGFKRYSRKEKVRFLNIAEGSIAECRYYLILARDLGYGETGELMGLLEEVSRMVTAYTRAIRASES
jgi:four helix bundle protein